MTLKVIGAGMARTGTSSLKAALSELGFGPCYQMRELLSHPEQVIFWSQASCGKPLNWDELFQDYRATVDFPSYRYYYQLLQYYPEAKVILTVRDPQAWYESTLNTIYQVVEPQTGQKFFKRLKLPDSPRTRALERVWRLVEKELWQKDFQGKFADKEYAIKVFQQHLEEVQQNVPSKQLLVYQITEGWSSLCRFLDVPVPEQTFPCLNERAKFKQRVRQLLSEKLKENWDGQDKRSPRD